MSKILFTDAQVKKLSKNKWIKNITNKGITYTDEFKYKLVKECENYKKFPQDIFKECNIDPEIVYSAMELALTSAYKKNFNSKTNVKVLFDRETGDIKVYSYLTVVPNDKMTKEEYDDALFERYAEDDELDTKQEIEETEDDEEGTEGGEDKPQLTFFNKETEIKD